MIKSAVVSATFRKKSAEEIVAICKQANISAVEWSSDVHLLKGDVQNANFIKDLCHNNNIEIAGYASYYRLGAYENYVHEFKLHLDVAYALGAKSIRIWAGNEGSFDISCKKRISLIEEANAICDMAETENIHVSFEYHAKTLTDTLKSTQSLLCDVPKAKTHWQIPNKQTLEQSINDVIALKDKLCNIHVHNCTDKVYGNLSDIKDDLIKIFKIINHKNIYACIEFVKNSTKEQFLSDAYALNEIIENCRG